jgi:DNA polymerase family A
VFDEFREVWAADFEFVAQPGERPEPVCMVARELRSGRTIKLWRGEFGPAAPFPVGDDTLFTAFYASAELGCFRALGWPMPTRILDLFTEFRAHLNYVQAARGYRRHKAQGFGLIDALTYFGLDNIGVTEKRSMIDIILRGPPWTEQERADILAYCASDVAALDRLFPALAPHIDLPRALLRGRYMAAASAMEYTGVPIDTEMLALLRRHWLAIQDSLIAEIDSQYGVYEGRTFKLERFARWLAQNDIPWPRLESGQLDLSDGTFRGQARSCPAVSPLRELRSSLSDLRLNDLAVGKDGFNRTLLSAFRSRTGRNQPSNAKFIFGPSVWLRSLIKPPPGYGVAYVDWGQQEFGIAAALSGDTNMQQAYHSGDPYLAFSKLCGAVPADATKHTHEAERDLYKACVLAVQYGMGSDSLAMRIGQPKMVARDLLQAHRETFPTFWKWSECAVHHAMLHGKIWTVFGWPILVGTESNPRSLANFLMQGNGSELLRLACCMATESGIEVGAPVHDAVLIVAPLDRIEVDTARMRDIMSEASSIVLGGFRLGTDVKIVRYPNRYVDKRGRVMWERVCKLVLEQERIFNEPICESAALVGE